LKKATVYGMNLPDGWELRESDEHPGRVFYINNIAHKSTWIRPLPYPGCDSPWPPLICITRLHVKAGRPLIDQIFARITQEGSTLEDLATGEPDAPVVIPPEWVARDSLPPEFARIWELAIGELSDRIDTADGSFLVLRNG
jgi:hypothetical protein